MKEEKDENSENSLKRNPIFIIVVFGVFLLFFNAGCDALFVKDVSFGQSFKGELYALKNIIHLVLIVAGLFYISTFIFGDK